jgi:hypothetical protein
MEAENAGGTFPAVAVMLHDPHGAMSSWQATIPDLPQEYAEVRREVVFTSAISSKGPED